jgi:fibronectin type 3 domain-containing protein
MKKQGIPHLAGLLLAFVIISCADTNSSGNSNGNHNDDQSKTTIQFDNQAGIFPVSVYSDSERQNLIEKIDGHTKSPVKEWPPSGSSVYTFYLSYHIVIGSIQILYPAPGSKNNNPNIPAIATAPRIDANKNNSIHISSLDSFVARDTLLTEDVYITLQNNSSLSCRTQKNDDFLKPQNLPASMVNAGETGIYIITAGEASSYAVEVNGIHYDFPASLENFQAGHWYSFVFTGSVVTLMSKKPLTLANTSVVVPAMPTVSAADSSITVSWAALEGAVRYEVYYSSVSTPPANPETTVAGTVTIITGLVNKTTYYVWVKAVYESDVSDYSPMAQGIPWPANDVPTAPDALTVIPGINQLTVSWNASGGASSYEVYQNTTQTPPSAPVTTVTTTSAVLNHLENGSIYYIWVKARNNNGTSAFSPIKAGMPATPTAPPKEPAAPLVTARNKALFISWSVVELTASYEVWADTSDNAALAQKQGSDIDDGKLETTLTGLTNGTTYYVWIKAKNSVGTSDLSPGSSGTPSAFTEPPDAPEAPVASIGNAQLTVSWTAAEGAAAYEVWLGTTNNAANAVKYGGDVSDTTVIISGLTNETTYYVWIKAKNSVGTSGFSPAASETPLGPPAEPGTPAVTTGDGQLVVHWQAVTDASVYEVWIGTTDNSAEATKYGADVRDTSTTIPDRSNGTTYYVWVKAKNTYGTSGFSPGASGTPLAPPVHIQAASQSAESILVSWDESAGGVSYKVYRSNTSGGNYTQAGTSSATSYTDSGLSADTTYYYKVSTVKGSDESALSPASVSATTRIGTFITITLASQEDVELSAQSTVIPRGQSRSFQVTEDYTSYQWYLNGNAISSATAAWYTLNTASMKLGVYELTVMVRTGAGAQLSGSCRVRVEE